MVRQINSYNEIGSTKFIKSAGGLMSKVYYDPQIKVGMPRQQVLQAAFNNLSRIRPNEFATLP